MTQGFFHDPEADPQQYLFGSGQVDAPPLQPDRDWSSYFITENQLWPWGDSLACASFNTLRTLSALIKRQWGINRDYADRALAKYTDTDKKGGNDPHFVIETIRKAGVPFETRWPSLRDIASFSEYYETLPSYVVQAFADFLEEFTLKHDTIRQGNYPSLQDAIWDALQYSPIDASFGYNSLDENGYWYKAGNHPDTHWAPIVGGEYGKFFLISDTAEPYLKKIAWQSFNPQLAKRYAVFQATNQPAAEVSRLEKIIDFLTQILGIQALINALKAQTPAPTTPSAPELPVEPPKPADPPPAPSTADRLYSAAYAAIGKDLSKQAPDERGCAEALSRIVGQVVTGFPVQVSTTILDSVLANHPAFKRIPTPQKGCIAIAPTQGSKIGHCWIIGNTYAMSNQSYSAPGMPAGTWQPNYKNEAILTDAQRRGLPLHYYLPR